MLASAQVCELQKRSTISAPGNLTRPQVVGHTSYVGSTSGIVRVDVTTPGQPTVLGTDATEGPVHDLVYEFFENILVTAEGSAGAGTYSLGGGTATEIAVTDLGESIVLIKGVRSKFFAGSEQGTLFTLAINADNEVQEYGSVSLGGEVLAIAFNATRAYCALGSARAIAIVDVTLHSDPILIDSHAMGGDVKSLVVVGNYLYASVAGVGIVVLEISDDSLVQVATLSLPNNALDIVAGEDRLYMTGPGLGMVEADISLAPYIIQFASVTLGGAEALDINGNLAHVGRGASGYSIVDVGGCSSSGYSPTVRVVTSSARDVGSEGSYWVTDAAFANMGSEPASVIVEYLAKEADNSSPESRVFGLAPGQQSLFTDVYSELFGMDSANGALRITVSYRDVKLSTKTYNAADPKGTYGQYIPASPLADAIGVGSPGGLPQLQGNATFRTNIGLVNLQNMPVKFTLHLFDANGVKLGARTRTLQPYEMYQYNRIFSKVTSEDIDSGFAMVEVLTTGGQLLAYAAVVDNGTSDAINIPAQIVTSGRPWLP